MKSLIKIFSFSICCAIPFFMNGQIIEANPFFYNGDQKQKLSKSANEILVKFKSNAATLNLEDQAEQLINELSSLIKMGDVISSDRAVRITLENESNMEEVIFQLLKREEVVSVYPVLLSKGSPIMITNTLIFAYNPCLLYTSPSPRD